MEPFREPKRDQERNRYRSIFESDMVGIFVTDIGGRIYDANDFFLKTVGYSRDDLKRGELNWINLTSPEFLDKCRAAGNAILAHKIVEPFEKDYIHKDGHRVPVVASLTLNADGYVVATVLDISKRKRAEKELAEARVRLEERVNQRTKELQQSEAFLEAVFENIPNMVFVKDAKDLRFVRFNRAGEELIGVPRTNMIGKNDYDFFPKDQADFFTAKDHEVLGSGKVIDIQEETIQTASGPRFLHTKKIPILNDQGQPQYLLGVSEDITEKKHLEKQRLAYLQEQIAREEAELRAQQMGFLSDISAVMTESFDVRNILKSFVFTVSASMTDICIVELLDDEGDHVEFTEVQARLPEDAKVVRAWKKKHPLLWDADGGPGDVLESGKPLLLENVDADKFVIDAFGPEAAQEKPVQVTSLMMTPIIMRNEKPVGLVTYLRKEKDQGFNRLDLSIAEEVTRRLAVAIENSKLYYKSQEASRAKSAFLANVSHEIRTPLGAMLGFAEILGEESALTDKQKKVVQIVLRNGQQLLRIVDEILDISKVESERIQIEHITFSLPSLLEDIVLLLKGRAEEKHIDLHMTYEALPEFIRTDPTRLRQILINVIGNAIKFTDVGHVEVGVRNLVSDSGESILEFKVADTGIGITEEQREVLFQAFAQADTSTTRRFGGTGLGLFLSRNLARLLGGDVILDQSSAGQGSCFVVRIAYEQAKRRDVESKSENADLGPLNLKGISRILIVDDASDNRDLFSHHLQKIGVREEIIDTASNGQEALSMAERFPYSLILMDIQMPEMDGFQALGILKKHKYPGMIVALTAHAMKGDEEKCLAAGFDGYLQKPLSKVALRKILELVNKRSELKS